MAEVDNLIYETSATIESDSMPFSDVDWAYAMDSQNSNYQSSQVIFDGSSLGSSDRFCDWRQAYITMPVVLALSDAATNLNIDAPFAAGLKNFYVNLINSASLEVNGQQIHQLCPYANFAWTFKALTEWSADDVAKWGPTLGFAKDNALSYGYTTYGATTSTEGDGISNNKQIGVSSTALNSATPGETSNQGLLQRQRMFCKDLVTASSTFSTFQTSTQATAVGTDFHSKTAGTTGNTKSKTWFIMAKIRLRDIFPAIAEMPLVKGLSPKITLNLNQGSATITCTTGTPCKFSTSATSISITGGMFPAMLTSSAISNGSSALSGFATTLYLGVYVGKVTNSLFDQNNVSHPTTTSCRLYAPLIKLHPSVAPAYTALGIKRKVKYNDLLYYRISSVAAGSTVNQLIASGVVNPKRVIIMPFYATSNTNAYAQHLSPFDTAPATRVLFAAISSVSIQVSGQNVWNLNGVYGYENFIHELASTTRLNGGYTPGLTSGLLSELDWQTLYYTAVCNIRPSPGEENVPKSVSVMFTNAANVTSDYFVFLEVGREVSVDIITGQVTQ